MLRHALFRAARAAKQAASLGLVGAMHVAKEAPLAASAARPAAAASGALAALAAVALAGGSAAACAGAPRDERSFVMIKPDGVNRGLVGEVVRRFEAKGYKLVGLKVLVPSRDLAGAHYAEHKARPFFPKLVDFLTSGPVVAMVWEGKEVVKYGRTMIGATNPTASAPGTIRGDFGLDTGRNIIHGSDAVESAQREIALWFQPEELVDYERAVDAWIYE